MDRSQNPRKENGNSWIRLGAWYDDRIVSLSFPEGWDVTMCEPVGLPDIGEEGIRAAFANPVGSKSLRELAQGKRNPCIVIDDLSRPTPGARLIPPLLEELRSAGIADDQVLIIAGVANHRPMTRPDLLKKLGDDVLRSCAVENHYSVAGCVPIGQTSFGSPVELNAHFMDADLKILVGSIIPHAAAGFSGGSKLLMPGIASQDSAEAYHRGSALRGGYALPEPDARKEADEAARMAGVDFLVNSIPNQALGIAGLVTGDVVDAHRAGIEIAHKGFMSPTPAEADACVLSVYPKDGEFLQYLTAFAPWKTAPAPLVREGGSVVVALDGVEGLGTHSLFGPGMPLDFGRAPRLKGRDIVFFSPHVHPRSLQPAARDDVTLFDTWEATEAWLRAKHGGSARVSVFPCATMQLGQGAQ